MSTRIVFAGGGGDSTLSFRVAEDIEDVRQAWSAASGGPVQLTHDTTGKAVCLNATNIAYIEEAASRKMQTL